MIAEPVFYFVRKLFNNKVVEAEKNTTDCQKTLDQLSALGRGILERLLVYVGLLLNFPIILSVFALIKVSTRLSIEQQNKVSNDYFLTGSMISSLVVFVYFGIWLWICGILDFTTAMET